MHLAQSAFELQQDPRGFAPLAKITNDLRSRGGAPAPEQRGAGRRD